jgi:hypothetical protein
MLVAEALDGALAALLAGCAAVDWAPLLVGAAAGRGF